MSNISPPRGYSAPFNVGSAAKEGGGNGSGGMYFGQEQPPEENIFSSGMADPWANADLEDITFIPPAQRPPTGLEAIRNALAVRFYTEFAKNPVPFLGNPTASASE